MNNCYFVCVRWTKPEAPWPCNCLYDFQFDF